MNKIEYQRKQEEIEQDYKNRKKLLDKEFAHSNNKIKIGDIIEINGIKIKVELMGMSNYYNAYPQLVYKGIRLTKSNNPFKNNEECTLLQQDIISINGKPYNYQEEIK